MLEKIEAVIFDLDGTLVDSMWVWNELDLEFLGKYGYFPTEEMQRKIEGMSFTETALFFRDYYHLEESVEEIQATWNRMAEEKYRSLVQLKPGAREFLEVLKEKKIPAGIASSNSRALIDAVLDGPEDKRLFFFHPHRMRGGEGKTGAGYLS